MSSIPDTASTPRSSAYRVLWRWHFYAGLLCIPFVLWLALTGCIYLFQNQIQGMLDKPYEHVAAGQTLQPAHARVQAALAAVSGSVLHSYQLPIHADDATQIVVGLDRNETRVYVNPSTLRVLKKVGEQDQPMRVLFHLHGELLMGDRGSMLVELAASWAIVMLLTGLYLWWPRGRRGLAGTLWPRLNAGRRVLLRDLHAVTGLWVSIFALCLLLSGLPWAASWGGLLKQVRQIDQPTAVAQDWTTGSSSEAAQAQAMSRLPASRARWNYRLLDAMVPTVAGLHLARPVLISPPAGAQQHWTGRSEASDRPLRVSVVLDDTGHVISRENFYQRPWVDRVIGIGVALHEGQLFGWINQALGVFTALGLITMCISAVMLWWRRRPANQLGAPPPSGVLMPRVWVAVIILLGVVLPLLGISLLLVLALERLVLRRMAGARHFLGLRPMSR